MERRFHVVFTGRLHPGFKTDEIADKMTLFFHLDRKKVSDLLSSGRRTLLKQGLSWEQAKKYQDHLERIGLKIKIIEADARRQLSTPSNSSTAHTRAKPKVSSQVNPPSISSQTTTNASRPAFLEKETSSNKVFKGVSTPKETKENLFPFRVESFHGWLWIKKAFGIFFKHPLKWTAMMAFMLLVILSLISIHPFGVMLIGFSAPVFLSGIAWGAGAAQSGELRIAHLFHGFIHNRFQHLLIGLVSLFLLSSLTVIATLCISKIASPASNSDILAFVTSITQNLSIYLTSLLGLFAFSVFLLMGCWFAPCLVALDNQSAFASFRLSFAAVRMNMQAFVIYGLTLFLMGLLFFFFYGATAALFAFFVSPDHTFLSMLLPMLFIILVAVPMTSIFPLSMYTGYRDIFSEQLS